MSMLNAQVHLNVRQLSNDGLLSLWVLDIRSIFSHHRQVVSTIIKIELNADIGESYRYSCGSFRNSETLCHRTKDIHSQLLRCYCHH
jgi:hypothetical protein